MSAMRKAILMMLLAFMVACTPMPTRPSTPPTAPAGLASTIGTTAS